jgi:hypothetical protein
MGSPFSRSLVIFSVIQSLMAQGASLAGRPELQYKSRGKGRGSVGKKYNASSAKYQPHQGKREIARRASQIQRGILLAS